MLWRLYGVFTCGTPFGVFLDVVGDLDFTLTCDLCSREQVGMLFVLVTLFLP